MPASPNVVIIVVKAGFGETIPNPNRPPKPAAQTQALLYKYLTVLLPYSEYGYGSVIHW
jgi:hypothetical protein